MYIDYKLIGGRIKKARNDARMTQENLAERLDVSVGYVSQVERGATKISLDLLGAISNIVGCDPAFLVTGSVADAEDYLMKDISASIEKLSGKQRTFLLHIIRLMLEENENG